MFVFVYAVGRDGDFLFIDQNAGPKFFLGSREHLDDNFFFSVEDKSDFFFFSLVVSGEDNYAFGVVRFVTSRAGVNVVAWVGHHDDTPFLSQFNFKGLVVEGGDLGFFNDALGIELSSKGSGGDSADGSVLRVDSQSLRNIGVKTNVLELGVSDWSLDLDIDGFKIGSELDFQVDFALFVLADGVFAHVGVSKVSHDAVDLVGHVLEISRDVLVFHGDVVLVEDISFLGNLLLSRLEFVSLFHLTFGQLGKRMLLQVLSAFLAALEFAAEGDFSSVFALFSEVKLSADFALLIVFKSLDKVDQWSFGHLAGGV